MKLNARLSPLLASSILTIGHHLHHSLNSNDPSSSSSFVVSAQPYADCGISTYYSSLLTNNNVIDIDTVARDAMHTLIKETHRNQLPYTSSRSSDVWDALIALDGDDSNGDGSSERVRLIYANTFVAAIPYDQGTCEYWNREHLWPRSRGIGNSGKDNTDIHHLRPSDCNINAARSNNYFGTCGTSRLFSECSSPAHLEAAFDTEKDSVTFLPPENRRGDVARAILYMDLRYDGDEDSTTTMDLVVSDCPESVVNGAGMGYLSQLLQWHLDDPPDEEERLRNDRACSDWQGNRNPFIDHPQLASIYHGGPRPLLGDSLGYDCTISPPPPPSPNSGICSDGSGSCTSVDQCPCASTSAASPFDRKLQTTTSSSQLIITGVIDGPLPGGLPKMVELYALGDVTDLSAYGIGSANNGGGSDGQEFTLSGGSLPARSFITIASESVEFANYFGETPTYTSGAVGVNGDDAIELFYNGEVADTFGDVRVDGTDQAWEYVDGWAYRKEVGSVAPVSGSVFQIGDWTLSGINAVDGCADNDSCGSSFPFKSFSFGVCECLGASTSAPTTGSTGPPPTKAPVPEPATSCSTISRRKDCRREPGCAWSRSNGCY